MSVALRELQEDDWFALRKCLADPETIRYTEFEPFTETSARWMVQWASEKLREQPRMGFVFGITLSSGGEVLGVATLMVRDAALRQADIGFIIGREHWGKGYATATVNKLLTLGFEQLNLHRIFGECDPANLGSARVMEKVNMICEGHLRECKWQKGHWVDRLLYAMLDHDWQAAREGT